MALLGFLALLLGLYVAGLFLGAGYRAGRGSCKRSDYRNAYKTEEPSSTDMPQGYQRAAAEQEQGQGKGALYPQAA